MISEDIAGEKLPHSCYW